MTCVAYGSKLRSVVRSFLCLGKWMAIGRAVVYYTRAAHKCCTGIKCRHCMSGRGYKDYTQIFQMSVATLSWFMMDAIRKNYSVKKIHVY